MYCRLLRVRPDMHGLRGRVSGRGHGRRAHHLYPDRFGLRRCLRGHREPPVPADRRAESHHACGVGGLPGSVRRLRRRVPKARGDARALPDLCRSLPPLRSRVRCPAGRRLGPFGSCAFLGHGGRGRAQGVQDDDVNQPEYTVKNTPVVCTPFNEPYQEAWRLCRRGRTGAAVTSTAAQTKNSCGRLLN